MLPLNNRSVGGAEQRGFECCCSVFKRLEERQKSAKDSADKTALRKLNRRLRAVHDELADYELLLQG